MIAFRRISSLTSIYYAITPPPLGQQGPHPLPVGSATEARYAKFEFARTGEKLLWGSLRAEFLTSHKQSHDICSQATHFCKNFCSPSHQKYARAGDRVRATRKGVVGHPSEIFSALFPAGVYCNRKSMDPPKYSGFMRIRTAEGIWMLLRSGTSYSEWPVRESEVSAPRYQLQEHSPLLERVDALKFVGPAI